MRYLIVFTTLLPFFINAQRSDELAIREVLSEQLQCWNIGDIDCFMEGYWKSEELVFVGSNGLTYGWQQTLDNYKKSYPTKEEMGTLSFDILIIEPLSEDFWSVIGKWKLVREIDSPEGHFSLLFRRLGQDWVIVSDHSS